MIAKGILRLQHQGKKGSTGYLVLRVDRAKLPPKDYLVRLYLPTEQDAVGNTFDFGVISGDLHSMETLLPGGANDILCSSWAPSEKDGLKLINQWGNIRFPPPIQG